MNAITKKQTVLKAAREHRAETQHLVMVAPFGYRWWCLGCLEGGSVCQQ